MLYLREEEVRTLLPMRDALQCVRQAFIELAGGAAANQPRRRLFLPTGSVLHQMSAWWRDYYGTKIYATNVKRGAMSFHVLLYDAATAAPLAFIEANYLGQIRTGAATGVATGLLALAGAETAAFIGSGFQAWTQLEAILAARPEVRKVRIFSRKQEKRELFAQEASEAFGITVEPVSTAEAAVRGAEIVTTATYAKEPVFENAWLMDGAHVNAAGANQKDRREIPAETVRGASLIAVDSLEQARIEAGDLHLAVPEPEWPSLPLHEIGELLKNKEFHRPVGVTMFESLGLAAQDIAAAAIVYERAKTEGAGTTLA